MIHLIVNLISYAMIRDEYREFVKKINKMIIGQIEFFCPFSRIIFDILHIFLEGADSCHNPEHSIFIKSL